MQKKKLIFIISFIIIIILFVPSAFYIYNFRSFGLSKSSVDWGSFGDFFGGVTNTIISLFSLAMITYISLIVSKFSSEENKKLYLLEKRIEAYDELLKFIPKLNLIGIEIPKKIKRITINSSNSIDNIEMNLEDKISNEILFCYEYHYFLFNFNARYNHLFKYDFNSNNYLDLIKTSKDFCNGMDVFHEILTNKNESQTNIQNLFNLHRDFLVIFINELKKEII